MRVVIALGGNALLKRGEPQTADHQRTNVRTAAQAGIGRLEDALAILEGKAGTVVRA